MTRFAERRQAIQHPFDLLFALFLGDRMDATVREDFLELVDQDQDGALVTAHPKRQSRDATRALRGWLELR